MTRRLLLLLFALLYLTTTSLAQTGPMTVLHVAPGTEPWPNTVDGNVTITLASGTRITIPATDLNGQATKMVNDSLQKSANERGLAAAGAADAPYAITVHCEKEWGQDFRMQAFCRTQAMEAVSAMNARDMRSSSDRVSIRRRCGTEWPTDYRMQNFCEEQQLKALQQLGR